MDFDSPLPRSEVAPGRLAWGRNRELQQHEHGFYDADQMIVVVAGPDELRPFVVVNHEGAHAMLTSRSGLGLMEHVLALLRWRERPTPPGATFLPALNALRGATETVHEAVAWQGTENDTAKHENQYAPRQYRDGVNMLWKLFKSLPGWPGPDDTASNALIAQAIGVQALSPPVVCSIIAHGAAFDSAGATIDDALAVPENAPIRRFRALCKALSGTPFEAVRAWARSVHIAADGHDPASLATTAKVAHDRVASIAASYAPEHAEMVPPLLRAVAARFPQIEIPADAAEEVWEQFLMTRTVTASLDVYAQTCVLPVRRQRTRDVYEGPVPPPRLLMAHGVTVSRALGHGDQYAWSGPRDDTSVTLFAHLPDGKVIVWVTEISDARLFLYGVWYGRPIVVSGIGYDFAAGDLAGVDLVRDLPHVVLRLGDFRSFWVDIAHMSDEGFCGSAILEWLPMPFPRNPGSPFGFLLLKAQGREYPVLLNPIVAGTSERVASIADALPSPTVRLVAVPLGAPYAWLGSLSDAVVTAGAIFESQCE